MEQSKSACVVLVVVFFALILAEPAAQIVHDARLGNPPAVLEVFTRAPSATNLRAYENGLKDSSIVANAIRPWLQWWRFHTMNDAGNNGLVGIDGWLFYKRGVQFLSEPWSAEETSEDPLPAIVSFRDQLRARGCELLLLIAPGKESVYPERLTRSATFATPPVNAHTAQFCNRLVQAGIQVLELSEVLRAPGKRGTDMYLKQDTHWSPSGAEAAAHVVADFIRDNELVTWGATYYTTHEIRLERHGDVLRMTKSEPLLDSIGPETIEAHQVLHPDTGEPYRDDPNAPILVMGDSFLRIYETDEPKAAGYIAHLARALHQPVASIVNDGGASTLVRQELRRKPELLRGKKLVIWEFVERDLRFGTDGWQDVHLPD